MANRDGGSRPHPCWCWLAASVGLFTACTAELQTEAKASGDLTPEVAETRPEPSDQAKQPAERRDGEEAQPSVIASAGPPGTITFIYRRRRITTCAVTVEEGQNVCAMKSDEAHTGQAEIVLTPVDDQGEEDPLRAEAVLSFDDEQSEQTREVELHKGRWELEWKGESTARDRFKVVAKDRFEITLEGIAGMCTMQGKACKLEPQKNQQVIELPEARGLR